MYENSSVCDNSTLSDEVKQTIQQKATEILAVKSLIDSIIPAFLSLFLCSWSDQHGRKPVLLAGYLGNETHLIITT